MKHRSFIFYIGQYILGLLEISQEESMTEEGVLCMKMVYIVT